MTQRLESRTAFVTGSTNGIGKAIAEAFAAEGAHVIITERRAEPGAEIVAKMTGSGGLPISSSLTWRRDRTRSMYSSTECSRSAAGTSTFW